TGKSTILKLILRLLLPDSGRVYVCGQEIADLSFTEALAVRQKMGMVFQSAALFDSMTVFENVAYPLREHTDLNEDEIEARV
ncbi:ATP-binding cassette domain-containing protein, partial [Escherichia coli]|uniref:ATP-binding cassette domain-containing protein n=1 Tax=Escherichia coli TaxID=562 RepID=UPI002115C0C7